MYFGNSLLDYFEISLFVTAAANREAILLLTYARFGVAGSEELEVNKWIALGIHWLSSQSEREKSLSTVLVYTKVFLKNNTVETR